MINKINEYMSSNKVFDEKIIKYIIENEIKNENLEEYVNNISFVNSNNKDFIGGYSFNSRILSFDLKNYYSKLNNFMNENNLYTKNQSLAFMNKKILRTIEHELTHAKQNKIIATKYGYIPDLLLSSRMIEINEYKLYKKLHEYFIHEYNAYYNGLVKTDDILNKTNFSEDFKEIGETKEQFINRNYKKNSPIEKFYLEYANFKNKKFIHKIFKYNNSDKIAALKELKNTITNEQRIEYGLPKKII